MIQLNIDYLIFCFLGIYTENPQDLTRYWAQDTSKL